MNKLDVAGIALLIAVYIVFRVNVLRRTYRRQRGRLGVREQSAPPKNEGINIR